MKPILFFILIVFSITGCKETVHSKTVNVAAEGKPIVIDTIEVLKKELVLNGNKGKWYYKEKPFNGYSLKFHENGVLEEKWGFYNGKREGIAKRWTKNKKLQVESYYKNNRLTGVYKSWYENGVLGSQCYYEDGVKQGEDKKWYSNGQLAKFRNLVDDKENGIQKAWLANGKLYVNYEAKNGRMFGMRRANSCYKLEDEIVVKN
ncbi:MAG: hypothetical protein ABJK28_14445 [Algibacter sp.]